MIFQPLGRIQSQASTFTIVNLIQEIQKRLFSAFSGITSLLAVTGKQYVKIKCFKVNLLHKDRKIEDNTHPVFQTIQCCRLVMAVYVVYVEKTFLYFCVSKLKQQFYLVIMAQ